MKECSNIRLLMFNFPSFCLKQWLFAAVSELFSEIAYKAWIRTFCYVCELDLFLNFRCNTWLMFRNIHESVLSI